MAPKNKFTKQQIIDAALAIARSEGLGGITAKKVAEQLGSSVAPIYVNFSDLNELIREVIKKVAHISKQFVVEIDSGNPFHDIGVASIKFARQYSALFRDLVLKPNEYMRDYDDVMGNDLVEMMTQDTELEGFSDEELRTILLKMRIIQTGLSVMVANGLLPEHMEEEQMIKLLDDMATDVVIATRQRRKKNR